MKTLSEWLRYIEALHPKQIELGLSRVGSVAKKLNLTTLDCIVITVGGTNGKGSCVKFLETILLTNHYRVGVYTSPHLIEFNERIRINDSDSTDDQLVTAFQTIERARGVTPLTFFEFTTLAAFWLFKEVKLDVIILEVGLGGRLDAVNLIDADIAIITSVDLDHQDWLGDTREQIGLEKAGIYKMGKLAICGDEAPPSSLIEYANDIGAELFLINKDFKFEIRAESWCWSGCQRAHSNLPLPGLPLINGASALMAVTLLTTRFNFIIPDVYMGLKEAKLAGRYQKIDDCILDVAHNPAAAKMLVTKLQSEGPQAHFKAVVGMLKDKDIKNTLLPLQPLVKEWYFGTLDNDRGASAQDLVANIEDFESVQWYTFNNVLDAFQAASKKTSDNHKIIVFGSFYTVSEVLGYLTSMAITSNS